MGELLDIGLPLEEDVATSSPVGVALGKASRSRGNLIPTGSVLLNLALSDNPYGGYSIGSMANLVGDSSAGKTVLAWNMFAEVVRDNGFDGYDLIYDDAESKLQLPLVKLFGKQIERVDITSSATIEEMDKSIRALLKGKRPFIYVIDSFDALSDVEERAKEELKRDYPAKPRLASEMLRKICGDIRNTRSFFLVVSQTRDAIGVTFGDKKTRSGGRALKFYCLHEVWLAVKGHIKRKDREVGVRIRGKTKKNHLTGKLREFETYIYFDYGVDDVTPMIEWLVAEGYWKQEKGKLVIKTGSDFIDATMPKLISYIEENDLVWQLTEVMADSWLALEESIRTDRPPRYE